MDTSQNNINNKSSSGPGDQQLQQQDYGVGSDVGLRMRRRLLNHDSEGRTATIYDDLSGNVSAQNAVKGRRRNKQ